MARIIGSASSLLKKIQGEEEVTIKFKKKDKSDRVMRCTLNFDKIPTSQIPKNLDMVKVTKLLNDHGIIHVFDLDLEEWRSIPYDRTEWVKTSEGQYKVGG